MKIAKPNLIDRMISTFSPGWASKRIAHRTRYNALASWDGAKKDRNNAAWSTRSGTADAHNDPDITLLIQRSRDLCRNTSLGRSVILSYKRNVVGTGIRPTAAAVDSEGSPIEEFNRKATRKFLKWAKNKRFCDSERRLTFWDMQRQVIGRVLEDGEAFVHRKWLPKNKRIKRSPIPMVIQRFEPDQLAVDLQFNSTNKNRVRRGVEIDDGGAVVAYHFYDKPLNDVGGSSPQRIERIPADRIDHIYLCERPGQSHGTPILSTVINKVMQISEFDNYEVIGAKINACFAMIINRQDQQAFATSGGLIGDAAEDNVDSRGNAEQWLEPGMIYKGDPGDEVKGVAPSRPGGMYKPFIEVQSRQIAAACDISGEQLTRDFTQGTYSSQRQQLLEDQRVFMPMQQFLIDHMLQPIWDDAVELMVLDGTLIAPQFFSDDDSDFLEVEWTPQAWGWVDPEKEAKAEGIMIDRNLKSKTRVMSSKGIVARDEWEQIRKDRDAQEELDLDPDAGSSDKEISMPQDGENPPPPGNTNGRAHANRFAEMPL